MQLDLSPWLLIAVPILGVVTYITLRGLTRNQFREPGKWGWFAHATFSAGWWVGTFTNVAFLGSSLFIVYMATFQSADFSRDPVLPMPEISGPLVETRVVDLSVVALSECLSNGSEHIYPLPGGGKRVAARNGRNQVMYIFEIRPEGSRSRIEVFRELPSPFVSWSRCTSPPYPH